MYICRCYFLNLFYPIPLLGPQVCSLCLHLHFISVNRFISTIFLYCMLLLLLLLLSPFSRVWLCATHRWQPTRLICPWDPPGKNTGVGCHFLLQCMKVKSESEIAQSCPTLSEPMDCSLPGSSVHGIFQARVLEWVAVAFSARLHIYALIHDIYFSLTSLCITNSRFIHLSTTDSNSFLYMDE